MKKPGGTWSSAGPAQGYGLAPAAAVAVLATLAAGLRGSFTVIGEVAATAGAAFLAGFPRLSY